MCQIFMAFFLKIIEPVLLSGFIKRSRVRPHPNLYTYTLVHFTFTYLAPQAMIPEHKSHESNVVRVFTNGPQPTQPAAPAAPPSINIKYTSQPRPPHSTGTAPSLRLVVAPSPKPNIVLVLAHNNEDVSWTSSQRYPVALMVKGKPLGTPNNSPSAKRGTECVSYLQYILDNWTALPDRIIFSQPVLSSWYIKASLLNNTDKCTPVFTVVSLKASFRAALLCELLCVSSTLHCRLVVSFQRQRPHPSAVNVVAGLQGRARRAEPICV